MTWSAPILRIRSRLRLLQTPVTLAPYDFAICTAKVPTPPDAPFTRTFCPGLILPLSRRPCRAVNAAIGIPAASSNVIFSGLAASLVSRAQAYSAKPPDPLVHVQN